MSAETTKRHTVSQVARLASVSVRTLHHYDEIGLLTPAARSDAGYRLYDDADLRRLHQILLFRELGFSLEGIGRLLDDPGFDWKRALRTQRELLREQTRRTRAVMQAIDATLEALEEGREMDADELFDGFDEFDQSKYEDEVQERWGDTAAYRESMKRTRRYTKDDWARIKAEGDGIVRALAELMGSGADPEGPEARALAEEHRQHIGRWFYPCAPAMHAGLADMYEADARFGEYFEGRAEGLTAFAAAAIRANAREGGQAPEA